MYPDHFIRESDVADEQRASKRNQQTSLRRLLRGSRVCILFVLALFGLYLLAARPSAGKILSQPASPGYASGLFKSPKGGNKKVIPC